MRLHPDRAHWVDSSSTVNRMACSESLHGTLRVDDENKEDLLYAAALNKADICD